LVWGAREPATWSALLSLRQTCGRFVRQWRATGWRRALLMPTR